MNEVRHVGIVPDGNRRFSKRLMQVPWKGHEYGAKKIEELMDWSREFGIKELTIYTFSIQNFDRPKQEFDYLMKIFKEEFNRIKDDPELCKKGLKINFIGRIHMFPVDVQKAMNELMEKTKNNSKYIINFAMAYGGREEIIDATKKIATLIKNGKLEVENIDEELFKKNLYLESEPDIIIRTSESRLSGFLPWQSTYSEIVFLPDLLWPEFKKEHFVKCIEDFKNRDRRFGL